MSGRLTAGQPSSPIEVVRACLEAWSNGDLPGVLARLSADCVYDLHVSTDVLAYGGRHEGLPAVQACLEAIREEFHFLAYAIGSLKQDQELVRGQIVFYYRHRETGAMLDGRFRIVALVKDEKIERIEEFHDVEMLRAFIGMSKGDGGVQ